MRDHTATVIPPGFRITQCKAMVAHGARKARYAARGDAPTSTHAAQSAKAIFANGPHHATRALAARGW